MQYNMEQLVKALAEETLGEVGFNDVEPEIKSVDNTWEHVAKMVVEEIKSLYEGNIIYSYGQRADEATKILKPLLEPYNIYPFSHKLLTAIEIITSNAGEDPRSYTNLIIRILDNDSAREWRNIRAFK